MKKVISILAIIIISQSFVFGQNTKAKKRTGEKSFAPTELRVEPTFWWTDMHNPNLQLMIYGEDIAKSEVSINYPGVSIVEKKLTDNPNYIFLYININNDTKAGIFNIELKKLNQLLD